MADRKTVLITGCSPGGIGHSLALEFHARGARVFATARSADVLKDLASHGIETLDLTVDDPKSIDACKAVITERTGGKLDILVNNAGRNYTMPALDVSLDEVRQLFEVNFVAVVAMCQAFAPLLINAKGVILQIGSVAAEMPYVFGSVYNASKAALHEYSDTLRVELAPFGVEVVIAVTGGVTSRIARTHRTLPEGSYYTPIADQYERRLTQHQSGRMTMPHETYAKDVVNKVWGRRGWQLPFSIRAGAMSWVVWFFVTFTPKSVHNIILSRMFEMWRLNPAYAKKVS